MNKISIITLFVILANSLINAQVHEELPITVPEPEFEQEAILLTSNTTGIPLEIEHAIIKGTTNIGMALLGETKGSVYFQLNGSASPTTLDPSAYKRDLFIIISWENNRKAPARLFQIIPLEIQEKRRIYNISKFNSLTGKSVSADQGYINFTATKYGDHSYLIKISTEELMKATQENAKDILKYGKQFIICILNSSTNNLSDTEDFITFGIEKPEKKKYD